MFESQALRPLNSELDEGEWPQLQLVDVVVYSQKYGSDNPIDILDVAEKGPFRVKGTLLKVPPKHKGIVIKGYQSVYSQSLYITKVFTYSIELLPGEEPNLKIWVLGSAGWYHLKSPAPEYKELYEQGLVKAELWGFVEDEYISSLGRKKSKTATFDQLVASYYKTHKSEPNCRNLAAAFGIFNTHHRFIITKLLENLDTRDNWMATPIGQQMQKDHLEEIEEIKDQLTEQRAQYAKELQKRQEKEDSEMNEEEPVAPTKLTTPASKRGRRVKEMAEPQPSSSKAKASKGILKAPPARRINQEMIDSFASSSSNIKSSLEDTKTPSTSGRHARDEVIDLESHSSIKPKTTVGKASLPRRNLKRSIEETEPSPKNKTLATNASSGPPKTSRSSKFMGPPKQTSSMDSSGASLRRENSRLGEHTGNVATTSKNARVVPSTSSRPTLSGKGRKSRIEDDDRFASLRRVRDGGRNRNEFPPFSPRDNSGGLKIEAVPKSGLAKDWPQLRPGRGRPPIEYVKLPDTTTRPGGVWTCPEDGCNRRVLDADYIPGKLEIERHWAMHGQKMQEMLNIVGYEQQQMGSAAQVRHLISKLDVLADQWDGEAESACKLLGQLP